MKYAIFMGCKIPHYLEQYGTSTRAVFKHLDVELVDLEFNCCGYPVRSYNFEASILSAARNIALAEKKNLDILTPCKCCYGSLKHADYSLRENDELRKSINKKLLEEGLEWRGSINIRHILNALYEDVGLKKIKSKVVKSLDQLKVAPSYGCHALRPSNITGFDNPLYPTIFEEIISQTGAKSVEWHMKLECCGNPLWEKNRELSLNMLEKKINSAIESEADCISSACTYCQIQFDKIAEEELNSSENIPSILVTQLLGLSFGLPEKVLGIKKNHIHFNLPQTS
jgi:heterodisulfide reductase subunit B